jgi:hypothetical protein
LTFSSELLGTDLAPARDALWCDSVARYDQRSPDREFDRVF